MLGTVYYMYNYMPLTEDLANLVNSNIAEAYGKPSSCIITINFGFIIIYASDAQSLSATILSILLGYYRSFLLVKPQAWSNLLKILVLSFSATFVRVVVGIIMIIFKIGGKEGITIYNLF